MQDGYVMGLPRLAASFSVLLFCSFSFLLLQLEWEAVAARCLLTTIYHEDGTRAKSRCVHIYVGQVHRGGRIALLFVIGFVFTQRSPGSNFKEPHKLPETFRYLFLII